MSWGGPEDGTETDYDRQFFNAHDVVFGAATGDDGYDTGASYPSTSPNVARRRRHQPDHGEHRPRLVRDSLERRRLRLLDERLPRGRGRPSKRRDRADHGLHDPGRVRRLGRRRPGRPVPRVYDTTGRATTIAPGRHATTGPSSAAPAPPTPIIVSTYALAGHAGPASSLVGQLYKNRAGLNDVVSGSNDTDPSNPCPTPTTRLCNAVAGWDGPTGLGTPNGLAAFTTTRNAPGTYLGAAPDRLLDTRVGTAAAKARLARRPHPAAQGHRRRRHPRHRGRGRHPERHRRSSPRPKGYITAYADGATRPTASNLNFVAKQTVPNLVVVPVSAAGYVDLSTTATTDLIADAVGYYLPGAPSVPGAFVSLPPTRLLDTRVGTGGPIARVPAGTARHLQVEGAGGVPATGVSAVVLNVTVDRPASYGFITVYPGGPVPTTSSVNYLAGQTVPNLVVAPLDANGGVDLYSYATTDLIADVEGTTSPGRPSTRARSRRCRRPGSSTPATAPARRRPDGSRRWLRDVVASARSAVPSDGRLGRRAERSPPTSPSPRAT